MGMNSRERKTTNRLSDSKRTSNVEGKSENNKKKNSKKIWSFDALVEAMKPSNMELEYRKNKRNESGALQDYSEFFECTVCLTSFETILKKHEKIPMHPCLGVLMCEECCEYYEDGEFSLDSDGEDKYCRWCGQGGTIFSCSECICGFCVKCIKRHFTREFYKQVQKDDNWLCFFCDPKPLWYHRFICSLAAEMSEGPVTLSSSPNSNKHEEEKNKLDSSFNDSDQSWSFKNFISKSKSKKESSRKRSYLSLNDESENEIEENHQKKLKLNDSFQTLSEKRENDPIKNLKSDVLKELDRILKLSENQMNFGVTWTTKMLKNLSNIDYKISCNVLVNKCQRIKSFLSVFSAHLVHLSNCADSLEKMLLKNEEQKTSHDHPDKEKSPYVTILQFLGFINNQVKTFRDKGISLSDILEAEVYDDADIIGIKKKFNSSKKDKNINPNEIKTSFRSDDFDDSHNEQDTEKQKFDDIRSKDGSSLEIVLNTSAENFKDRGDEFKDFISSNVTPLEINSQTEAKDDIQEILAILENA